MWSKPIIITTKAGKEVALLIMDCEGLYDADGSDNTAIKLNVLCTWLSSTIVFLNTNTNNSSIWGHSFLTYPINNPMLE